MRRPGCFDALVSHCKGRQDAAATLPALEGEESLRSRGLFFV